MLAACCARLGRKLKIIYSWSAFMQREFGKLCSLQREPEIWEQEQRWLITKLKGKTLFMITLNLAWNARLYWVWNERNNRVFLRSVEKRIRVAWKN
ncbi:DNA ligase [Gossypium australe]|uniref:DNA ligase n=1 Tax=Gossypium australe TaxID=47621 RepID=A0A5B6WCN0_9ROSI|nr:DNA ligase [Gossypium australe]